MKNKSKMNTKPQAEINMVLAAVAPTPKLSTDAIALDGAVVSRGNGIGASSEVYLMDCIVGMKHYPDKYFGCCYFGRLAVYKRKRCVYPIVSCNCA